MEKLMKYMTVGFMATGTGAFLMSGINTQDQQLAGRAGFDKDEIKDPIFMGWAATGSIIGVGGVWTKNKWLMLGGAGVVGLGYWWTYMAEHPVFPLFRKKEDMVKKPNYAGMTLMERSKYL